MLNEILTTIAGLALNLFVITSMLAMGLNLTTRQIMDPLRNVRLVVLALVGNFVLVPALAWGLTAVLFLANAALNHSLDKQNANADATLSLTRAALNKVILQETTFDAEIKNGAVEVKGSLDKVHELISLLDAFEFWFNIVTP